MSDRNSNSHEDLWAEIERARMAAERVAVADQERRTAEQLPRLQAALAAAEAHDRQAELLAQLRFEAEKTLAEARPEIAALNTRYTELVGELEQLLAQKDQLQSRIIEAGLSLRRAGAGERLLTQTGFGDPALTLLPSPRQGNFGSALWQYLFAKRPPYSAQVWHYFL